MRKDQHTHSFAVDTSCDCGIMLSRLVSRLSSEHTSLRNELQRMTDECYSIVMASLVLHPRADLLIGRTRALLGKIEG